MNNLVNVKAANLTAHGMGEDLIKSFVAWIDRGEKTTRSYITNLHQFARFLSDRGITAPSREDIIEYRDELTATRKANTAAQYIRTVKQFFAWTQAAGVYPDIAANIHAPKIRHDTHKKDALSAADVLKIEKSIDRTTEQGKRLYALYLLSVNAGLRTIELHRANIKDIEVKAGRAVLYVWGKGHSEPDQKKPLAPEVFDAIKEYIESRTDNPTSSAPLFVSTGNRSGGKRIATTTISTMLKRAMQNAGYNSERITAHSLRHTAGTAVQEITGDIYATQKYMRHSNPATTEIYLHNDTEKAEANIAQRLFDYYHAEERGADEQRDNLYKTIARLDADKIAELERIVASL